jgi:hypothetical protein
MPYAAAAAVRRSPFGRFILWPLYVPRFLDSQVPLWQRSCRGLAPPSGVVVGPALPYSAFPAASPYVDGSTASPGFGAVASSGILPAAVWTTNAHDAVGKAERGGLWLWKLVAASHTPHGRCSMSICSWMPCCGDTVGAAAQGSMGLRLNSTLSLMLEDIYRGDASADLRTH